MSLIVLHHFQVVLLDYGYFSADNLFIHPSGILLPNNSQMLCKMQHTTTTCGTLDTFHVIKLHHLALKFKISKGVLYYYLGHDKLYLKLFVHWFKGMRKG